MDENHFQPNLQMAMPWQFLLVVMHQYFGIETLMNKFQVILTALAAIAIVLCMFLTISALGMFLAPAFLKFAQDYFWVLQSGTLFLLLIAVASLLLNKRRLRA